jgi:hypothetical protein
LLPQTHCVGGIIAEDEIHVKCLILQLSDEIFAGYPVQHVLYQNDLQHVMFDTKSLTKDSPNGGQQDA